MSTSDISDPLQIIDHLSPNDAHAVLRRLVAQDEALAGEIVALALAYLSEVDWEEVASSLRFDLESLTPEEVWDRAGTTRYGYVETGEAAEEMIEEIVAPYLDEMRKYQKMGLADEARQMCKGLMLGYYEFEHESERPFKDWAIDSPLYFAGEVLEVWREARLEEWEREEARAFIDEELPGWASSLLAGE